MPLLLFLLLVTSITMISSFYFLLYHRDRYPGETLQMVDPSMKLP